MVEVAVIGFGAAGLVATRHLLRCGLRAIVFEGRRYPGGAWSTVHDVDGSNRLKMWDSLSTNLSKYTCAFSDYPWADDAPTFASSGHMSRYLEGYADKYVLNNDDCTVKYGSCALGLKTNFPGPVS